MPPHYVVLDLVEKRGLERGRACLLQSRMHFDGDDVVLAQRTSSQASHLAEAEPGVTGLEIVC